MLMKQNILKQGTIKMFTNYISKLVQVNQKCDKDTRTWTMGLERMLYIGKYGQQTVRLVII